jgi:predicted secreted protein
MNDLDNESLRTRYETNGIMVRMGKTANFMLKENSSTGYIWIVDEAACDDKILKIETWEG